MPCKPLATLNADFVSCAGLLALQLHSEGAQSDLAMIARAHRLFDSRFAVGEKAREEQAGLHLRAGDGHFVINRFQRSTRDSQRRLSLVRLDLGTHGGKRLDDTFHGATGEGFIADHLAGEALSGDDAAQHPHGGAGISAVERRCRGGEREAAALHFDDVVTFGLAFPIHAHRAHATQRAGAVGAGGIVFDARRTFGNSR